MDAHQVCKLVKQESCRPALPGEGGITHHYDPAPSYRNGKLHAKLHVSIAPVSRDPAHSQAALLLTQLGGQETCTHQCLTVQHRLRTLQVVLRRTYSMMNGPSEECGCCVECEECDCTNNAEICDCSCTCTHEIEVQEQSSTSPLPPPPLRPTPAQSSSRPPPRESPPRCRTRSRSRSPRRSPTPLVRRERRYSRDSREGSVSDAARYVVNRIWRDTKRDRKQIEEKWENQSRKLIAQFKIGHKEGITCTQRLHNSYVLPQTLSLTFLAGFLTCLIGIMTGLIIMWSAAESL